MGGLDKNALKLGYLVKDAGKVFEFCFNLILYSYIQVQENKLKIQY